MTNFLKIRISTLGIKWKVIAIAIFLMVVALVPPLKHSTIPHFTILHTIMEIACILVAIMIFVIKFVLRRQSLSGRYELLGIPFLGIAIIDLLHTLSFPGMPDLVMQNTAQKSIFFWLAGRLLEMLTLLGFALITKYRLQVKLSSSYIYAVLTVYVLGALIWFLVFPNNIPLLIDATGNLSALKVSLEALFIIVHLFIAGLLISFSQESHDSRVPDLVTASLIFAIGGICFSLYHGVTDLLMLVGHLLKILGYFFVFRSCLANELLEPYELVVRLGKELKMQAQGMRELQTQLLRAERGQNISKEISSVVHDINNVLAVTMSAAERINELVSDEDSKSSIKRFSDTILKSVSKGKTFNQMLLDKARGEASSTPIEIDLASEIAYLRSFFEMLVGLNCKIEINYTDDLKIVANVLEFEQVILNLVINAKDAIPEAKQGYIRIEFDKSAIDSEVKTIQGILPKAKYVRIRVSDNGNGIAERDLPKIFDLHFTTKGPSEGSGIGLSTVKELVEKWGGHIAIHSRLGEGTVFSIYIPDEQI